MSTSISIENFIKKAEEWPILDVRSPSEFAQGHIPGAVNLPLFNDEERATIGTIYKQQNREKAILKGLEFVGPKMRFLVEEALKISPQQKVLLQCWRGGMRSGSVAWLLQTYGFEVQLLKGGYKTFRNWVSAQFNQPKNILILGGKTGSGKTEILQELKKLDEEIIDLEDLAKHKGSAFGAIGQENQPTQEQFENLLAVELYRKSPELLLWLEDEGRTIGRKVIPESLFVKMRNASLIYLDINIEKRVKFLVEGYGKYPKNLLEESINKVAKRLGGLSKQQALRHLDEGNLAETAKILLGYYDKSYLHEMQKRNAARIFEFVPQSETFVEIAQEVQQFGNQLWKNQQKK